MRIGNAVQQAELSIIDSGTLTPKVTMIDRLKPFVRWLILGGTLFFLVRVLRHHWRDVAAIRVTPAGWLDLAIALAVTLAAHVWAGWVWGDILRELNQPVSRIWSVTTYLKTNIAKYLPGNVWHFYGRIWAAKAVGVPIEAATLSVLMEPLLMAAAALVFALVGTADRRGLQVLSLAIGLAIVHPRLLNPLLRRLGKQKSENAEIPVLQLRRYPLLPFLGELGFLGLRGVGFLLTLLALQPMVSDRALPYAFGGALLYDPTQIPLLLGSFSFAWLLGLVIPGAPGGLGVFEATTIALLQAHFSPAILISLVALYRLISVLAEVAGAGLAWLGGASDRG